MTSIPLLPIVSMFSGQGSQYYQMARELFAHNSTFNRWMHLLDSLFQQHIGESILAEMYAREKKITHPFDHLLKTHPAIFMVEYSLAQLFMEKGIFPNFVLGSSLGEFAAAALAGVLPLEAVVECLVKQASVIENLCPPGKMVVILKPVEMYYAMPLLFKNSELVSINREAHFVISGASQSIDPILQFLQRDKISHLVLPVVYGFHSAVLDAAKETYLQFLERKKYQRPNIPLVSCAEGGLVEEISSSFFWDIARKPIQLQKAFTFLQQKGSCLYLDLGPSGMMANMAKYSLSDTARAHCASIVTPFHQELQKLLEIDALFQFSSQNNL